MHHLHHWQHACVSAQAVEDHSGRGAGFPRCGPKYKGITVTSLDEGCADAFILRSGHIKFSTSQLSTVVWTKNSCEVSRRIKLHGAQCWHVFPVLHSQYDEGEACTGFHDFFDVLPRYGRSEVHVGSPSIGHAQFALDMQPNAKDALVHHFPFMLWL